MMRDDGSERGRQYFASILLRPSSFITFPLRNLCGEPSLLFSVKQKVEKGPDERGAALALEQYDRKAPIELDASQPHCREAA
jgi:hypothetical protein